MQDTSTLTLSQKKSIDSLLNLIANNCMGKALIDYMINNNRKFTWVVDSNSPNPASYTPVSDYITIKNFSDVRIPTLQEEIIHAYQNFNIPGGSYQYRTNHLGSSNIEFESKLLRDISAWVNGSSNAYAILSDPTYYTWLDQITNNGTKFPSSYNDIQSNYFYFMGVWQNEQFIIQNDYRGDIINTALLPTSMFNLINSSSCSK